MRLYIKYYIVTNNKLCYDINYILLTYISTTHTHTHTHTDTHTYNDYKY
jgi:hypothetical protein